MGTVLEKANEIKKTKNKLKEAINNGGGQITDDIIFNDYANEIKDIYIDAISNGVDNIYNNFPKVIGEGSEITLNTEEAPINITLEGNTSQKTSVLPEEYTQVNYIESSGTQYIDTGVNADSNKKISITTQYTDISNQNNTNMFAIRVSDNLITRLHFMTQTNRFRFYYGLDSASTSNFINLDWADTLKHDFEFDLLNGIVKKDNTEYNIEKLNFNLDMNMYLFARNAVGAEIFYNKSKLYSCKLYDNDVLIRDFIPCYRNSDNEVGMYDLITDTFYTNQGTGVFTYGSVVTIPNPDYPQDIKVVTGEQNIEIMNGNLFNPNLIKTSSGTITVGEDGSIIMTNATGSSNGYYEINKNFGVLCPDLKVGDEVYLYLESDWTSGRRYVYNVDLGIWKNGQKRVLTAGMLNKHLVIYGGYRTTTTLKIMITKNKYYSEFLKYQPKQTYPLSLSNIELARIDNYKDYIFKNEVGSPYYNANLDLNEWYLHKEIGEKNIDVSTITLKSDYSNIEYAIIPKANDYIGYNEWGNKPVIYTHALFNNNPSNWNNSSNVNKIYSGSEKIYWWLGFTKGTGLVNIKSQLEDSVIYYPLKNPTNTKITDTTLISQLENINNNAHSYSGTTIIECSSVNDNNEAIQASTIALKNIDLIESEWEE